MDSLKGALFSKTVWFNLIVTAIGLIDWIGPYEGQLSLYFPKFGPILSILGPLGIFLRTITNTPLAAKVAPATPPATKP